MRPAFEHQPRHFLDEQRDPARANCDTFDCVGGERTALRNGANHLAHLLTIERDQRNDPMVRARNPRRAKFGARCRDDHERRRRASFGEDLQQIKGGRVCPMEIFEGVHERLIEEFNPLAPDRSGTIHPGPPVPEPDRVEQGWVYKLG